MENRQYSVRLWDSFWCNWAMIPITDLTREEAINKAIELSDVCDMETEEPQVWIDCGMNTAQMVGYVDCDDEHSFFVEAFC